MIKAKKTEKFYVQKLSRSGKAVGNWVYITPLTKEFGFDNRAGAEEAKDEFSVVYSDDAFRVVPRKVFI